MKLSKPQRIILSAVLIFLLLVASTAMGEIPRLISFQGQLLDTAGDPVSDGDYTMTFSLYDVAAEGSVLWSETLTVAVEDGLYHVNLGAAPSPLELPFDVPYFLGVTVGSDAEMTPRLALTSTGYAMRAETADALGDHSAADFIFASEAGAITAASTGAAFSVTNTGGGPAAFMDGALEIDHGDLMVHGEGSFDEDGETGALYLGDAFNYIKAVNGSGIRIGTFDADDAIVVEQGTGNVGIGVDPPSAKLDVAGTVHASGSLEIGSAVKSLSIFTDGAVVDIKSNGAALGINYPGDTDTVINVGGGNVGIGVDPPSEKLSVSGTVESTSGGFKFPDGSTQANAAYSQAHVDALEARIAALESTVVTLTDLLAGVTRAGNDITFSGVNVRVVNGAGGTSSKNGLGNLIVGYDEARAVNSDKSGSHNVVVGSHHNYGLYGGIVAGYENTLTATAMYASVLGGQYNTAEGWYATVSGGRNNTAHGNWSNVSGGGGVQAEDGNYAVAHYSSILGGTNNVAGEGAQAYDSQLGRFVASPGQNQEIGQLSVIGGGESNLASAENASIFGGHGNTVTGETSSISGGFGNTASGYYASVSGGLANIADGWGSSISGGSYNEAIGEKSSISGGSDNDTLENYSSISGGISNTASGYYSSVSGGNTNTASGWSASVSGGTDNMASETHSSVSGGQSNTASGESSSVSGGTDNTASVLHSSVSGGQSNSASGEYSSISGGQGNTGSGQHSSVSGGRYNKASGNWSFVGGGGHSSSAYGNEAFSNYSAILGGSYNIAGDNSDSENHSVGELSTIVGGDTNRANGGWSSILGGKLNEAYGSLSCVSGGHDNLSGGAYSSVSGGHNNWAYGQYSSVIAGENNMAVDDLDSVVGDIGRVWVDGFVSPVH